MIVIRFGLLLFHFLSDFKIFLIFHHFHFVIINNKPFTFLRETATHSTRVTASNNNFDLLNGVMEMNGWLN